MRSIISENDSSVAQAMESMGEGTPPCAPRAVGLTDGAIDEREAVDREARLIQSNVRRWMLERAVDRASKTLQRFCREKFPACKKKRVSEPGGGKTRPARVGPAEEGKGEGDEPSMRNEFGSLKRQVTATLVLQKYIRARQQRRARPIV